jgi:hypothetical protein
MTKVTAAPLPRSASRLNSLPVQQFATLDWKKESNVFTIHASKGWALDPWFRQVVPVVGDGCSTRSAFSPFYPRWAPS